MSLLIFILIFIKYEILKVIIKLIVYLIKFGYKLIKRDLFNVYFKSIILELQKLIFKVGLLTWQNYI